MKEQWKTIDGFPDYAVSNLGRVKRLTNIAHGGATKAGKILKPQLVARYLSVNLCPPIPRHQRKRIFKSRRVHRLVAQAFIPNPLNLPYVNHKKGKQKFNNRVSNLEWTTPLGNTQHAVDTGLIKVLRGSKCGASRLNTKQVLEIRVALSKGVKQRVLAKKYSIARSAISLIKTRRNWKHVKKGG